MKKNKKKFISRLAALFCALVVAASCFGSVPYYADESSVISVFKSHSSDYYTSVDFDIPYDLVSSYEYYYVFVRDDKYCFLWGTNTPFEYECVSDRNDTSGFTYYNLKTVGFGSSGSLYVKYLDGTVDWKSTSLGSWGLSDGYSIGASYYLYDDGTSEYSFNSSKNLKFVESNSSVYLSNDDSVFLSSQKDIYSSSLGYLQNVRKKDLTLDGENYVPDYDSWLVMYTFDSNSTTGIDITSGGYTIRHYTGYEVCDRDFNIVRSYDIVLSGEYDAASCKLSYPLYSTRQEAMDACGFEPLSWWEDSVLGYEHYIYDYLQIVHTNEDGSVEYGGYVKISEAGEVSTTLSDDFTVDSGGYVDKEVPESSGSGSNYEDAEHDADENAANSSDSSTDFMTELNNMISMVSVVPQLFGKLFSFLPDWCLNFLGVGVGFTVMLLLWKAARG